MPDHGDRRRRPALAALLAAGLAVLPGPLLAGFQAGQPGASGPGLRLTRVAGVPSFSNWLVTGGVRAWLNQQPGGAAGLPESVRLAVIAHEAERVLRGADRPLTVRWDSVQGRIEFIEEGSPEGPALHAIDLHGLAETAARVSGALEPLISELSSASDAPALESALNAFFENGTRGADGTISAPWAPGEHPAHLLPSEGTASAPRLTPPTPAQASAHSAVDAEAAAAIKDQREKLVAWQNSPKRTVVAVNSLSWPFELGISGIEYYDTRNLAQILQAADPGVHVIYVTATRISPAMLDHVLNGRPDKAAILSRVHLVPLDDLGPEFLSQKLVAPRHAEKLARVRNLIAEIGSPAAFIPFFSTPHEWFAAAQLGIPNAVYGPHHSLRHWGGKSGNRKIFKRVLAKHQDIGVRITDGEEDVHDLPSLLDAVISLISRIPGLLKVVAKLDWGGSGVGNSYLPVSPWNEGTPAAIEAKLKAHLIGSIAPKHFIELMEKDGAAVEAFISGLDRATFPSGQAEILPDGSVRRLSTHEQILEDRNDFLGAYFPAAEPYRKAVDRFTAAVGHELAKEGIVGRFAIDFAAIPREDGSGFEIFAIEINIRQGGTTHPYLAATGLTGATYDAQGLLRRPDGSPVVYKSLDHDVRPNLKGLSPDKFLEFFSGPRYRGLLFDHEAGKGVVFHLLPAVEVKGNVGYTIIADDRAEIERIQKRLTRSLDELELVRLGAAPSLKRRAVPFDVREVLPGSSDKEMKVRFAAFLAQNAGLLFTPEAGFGAVFHPTRYTLLGPNREVLDGLERLVSALLRTFVN